MSFDPPPVKYVVSPVSSVTNEWLKSPPVPASTFCQSSCPFETALPSSSNCVAGSAIAASPLTAIMTAVTISTVMIRAGNV